MRNLKSLDARRNVQAELELAGVVGGERHGMFAVPSPDDGRLLRIMAANDLGWDHVSVSREDRCPTWAEMDHVKRMFFRDDETAMQLHVPAVEHIDCHPFCLHLWRPWRETIPRPPAILV